MLIMHVSLPPKTKTNTHPKPLCLSLCCACTCLFTSVQPLGSSSLDNLWTKRASWCTPPSHSYSCTHTMPVPIPPAHTHPKSLCLRLCCACTCLLSSLQPLGPRSLGRCCCCLAGQCVGPRSHLTEHVTQGVGPDGGRGAGGGG
jgi:hypothetical protein